MLSEKKRKLLLAVALALSIWAAVKMNRMDNSMADDLQVAAPASPHSEREAAKDPTEDIPAVEYNALKERPQTEEKVKDAFAVQTWDVPVKKTISPPPPPPPVPPQRPAPTAPALPFKFMGRITQNGVLTLFVTNGTAPLVIKQGDVIDNIYKVDEIKENAVTFTYLPLNVKQTLQIGAAT